MISLEVSLKHLAWSNQKFFQFFTDKNEDIFGLRAAADEWPIGKILTHLAGSGEWYTYCLTGEKWSDLKPIKTGAIAQEYIPLIADLDSVLLKELSEEDESLEIDGDGEIIHATRSLILSQAVMHAAEHKGQIASILKQHGHHIDLDALDVWSFISETKN